MSEFSIDCIEYELGEQLIEIKNFIKEHERTVLVTGIPKIFETNLSCEDIAIKAGKKILRKIRKQPEVLIYVSQSPHFILPGSSVLVHEKLNLNKNCLVFDINAGCSGFAQALVLSSQLIKKFKNILIICADTYRKKLDRLDRSTMAVFSDAASAIFISNNPKLTIENINNQVSGENYKLLFQEFSNVTNKNFLKMHGKELWSFTRLNVLPDLDKTIAEMKKKKIDLKHIFVHQASKVVVDGIAKHLDDQYIVHRNYMKVGNTVSSSIPILIKQSKVDINSINSIISGFGVGLISCTLGLKKI